jgi:hypothetical protein
MNIYLTFIGDKKTLPCALVWYLNYSYILSVNSNDINAGMCAISLLCMKSWKFLHQLAKSERSSNMNRAHKNRPANVCFVCQNIPQIYHLNFSIFSHNYVPLPSSMVNKFAFHSCYYEFLWSERMFV